MKNTILTDAEISVIYSSQFTTVECNSDDYTPDFLDSYDDIYEESLLDIA